VVRDNGGHVVALKWTMKNIYNVDAGDVYWAASDVGWVVGHSYIVYGPLFKGCTTILFEGKPVGTPGCRGVLAGDCRAQGQSHVYRAHGLSGHQTRGSQCRADEEVRPVQLQGPVLAGERLDPNTLHWAEDALKVPVIDHWWQTETGWAIAPTAWVCMSFR
jgi:propionyl-CoA synthetase